MTVAEQSRSGRAPLMSAAARRDLEGAVEAAGQALGPAAAACLIDAAAEMRDALARRPDSGSAAIGDALGLPGVRLWIAPGFPYAVFYRLRGARAHLLRVIAIADLGGALGPAWPRAYEEATRRLRAEPTAAHR